MTVPYIWYDWGEADPLSLDELNQIKSNNYGVIKVDFLSKSYRIRDDSESNRFDYLDLTISNASVFSRFISHLI